MKEAACKEEVDSLKKRKLHLEEQIDVINKNIEERSKSNQDSVDALRAENEKSIDNFTKQCENDLKPMISNLKRELKLLNDTKSQKDQDIHEIERKKHECLNDIRNINNKIENVRASVKNKLSIYGEHMPALINAINKAHSEGKFSVLPRGPIGNYVEVPKPQYRDIIEHILGGAILNSFIVNNKKDRETLGKILDEFTKNRPNIITTTFRNEVYDVSRGCVHPPSGTILALNEIHCEDPVVKNCLIDQKQLETILITSNKNIAEHLTSNENNVPRNLKRIYVLNENKTVFEYYPMPRYRVYSSKIRQANYIQINIDELLSNLQNEKINLEKRYKIFEKDLNHVRQEVPHDSKLIQEKRSKLDQHEDKLRELQEKIKELQDVEYADYSEQIKFLNKEIDETKNTLEKIDKKLGEKRAQLFDCERDSEKFEEQYGLQIGILQQIQKEIEDLKSKLDQYRNTLRSIKNNESQNQQKLAECKENLDRIETERKKVSNDLEKATVTANEKGIRVDTVETIEELQENIAKIKAKLKHGMPVNLDSQSIHDLIVTKKESLDANQGIYENIKLSISMLRKSLKFRFDFLKKLKEHMAVILEYSFKSILQSRHFCGTITIDHKEKKLEISVVPRDHTKNAVSSTKALSGGERSFSTVAFLISLWWCVDHPFYFLDEYDVFTDEVNREYMTRLLIDEGRTRAMRQYSFLTPLDMTLAPKSFIKIHRLQEPDRR